MMLLPVFMKLMMDLPSIGPVRVEIGSKPQVISALLACPNCLLKSLLQRSLSVCRV